MSRVLVIDDDDAVRELIRFTLERDGFEVEALASVTPAFNTVARNRYDAIVLDANLPQVDGFTFLEWVRTVSRVPILMVTVRHGESDIVRALDLGADDYITKPFSPRELLARVRTVMHRYQPADAVVLVAGDVWTRLDLAGHFVTRSNDARPQNLTASEIAVLSILLRSRGRLVPWGTLLRALGDSADMVRSRRTLDVHICRIRRKIEPRPECFEFIRTVRGVGYLWVDDPEVAPLPS